MSRTRPQSKSTFALALGVGALLIASPIALTPAFAQEAPPAGTVPAPVSGPVGNTTQDVLRQAETGSFRRSVEDLIDRIRGQVRNVAPGGVVTPAEAQAPAAGTVALPAPGPGPTSGAVTVAAPGPALPAAGGVALPPAAPASGTIAVPAGAPATVAIGRPGTVAVAGPRVAQSSGVVVGRAATAEIGAVQVTSGPATKVIGAVKVSAEKPVVIGRVIHRGEPRRYGTAAWCW